MTRVTRWSLRESVGAAYFGDGPPHWIISAGKRWERATDTYRESVWHRDEVVRKLDWHRRDSGMTSCATLARKLEACQPNRRCFSGACPICLRAVQRWFVVSGLRFGARLKQDRGQKLKIFSLVPDFGEAPLGALAEFDWNEFRGRAACALREAGADRFLTGIDVSLNHFDSCRDEAVFQFQLWGLIEEPREPWRKRLKDAINRSCEIARPLFSFEPRCAKASLAYGLKREFTRRVSYVRDNAHRDDRGAAWDTRGRKLRGAAWVELMLVLDRIGLPGRIVSGGADIGAPGDVTFRSSRDASDAWTREFRGTARGATACFRRRSDIARGERAK